MIIDYLKELEQHINSINELTRESDAQNIDIEMLRNKVAALQAKIENLPSGGVDVNGIVKGAVSESKGSNAFSSTYHTKKPTLSGTSVFQPDTLYLVMLSAEIYFALPTGTAADIMVYGTIGVTPDSTPSGMTLTMDPRYYYHPQFRVVQPAGAGQTSQMVHTYVYQNTFIYGYTGVEAAIALQLSAMFRAVNWGTTTAYTGSGWRWGNIEYVAIPIGKLEV